MAAGKDQQKQMLTQATTTGSFCSLLPATGKDGVLTLVGTLYSNPCAPTGTKSVRHNYYCVIKNDMPVVNAVEKEIITN